MFCILLWGHVLLLTPGSVKLFFFVVFMSQTQSNKATTGLLQKHLLRWKFWGDDIPESSSIPEAIVLRCPALNKQTAWLPAKNNVFVS